MPKKIDSPVKQFPGYVVLYDPMFLAQVLAWEDCILEFSKLEESARRTQGDKCWLPGICACVQEWHIDKFKDKVAPETFPFSPRGPTAELIAWIVSEINHIYLGDLPEEEKNE